ncbi:MAG: universal stress protein [marine benthic group bacterium]|jgi:nucleotide-binding universal stress UspA family protein|nr:universal stress protein [Gemmatimonadota bacterium]MCL7938004.1 universal stress protein [Gemmatimonadota bacterium]MCL7991961.1 universal stress protein [Gemmatimonadota bacterium]
MFQTILVPVELTEKDLRAVDAAGNLAAANLESDTEIVLLHVIETLDLPFEELEDFYSKLESRAVQVMDELAASLASDRISVVHRIAFGSRVPEILAHAEEMAADLVILVARKVDPSDPGSAWSGIAYQTAILSGLSVLLLK